MALVRRFPILLAVAALAAIGCSSGSKTATTGSTAGTSGTGSATTGAATSSGTATATTSGSTTGGKPDAGAGCATDLDCASVHEICSCGGTRPCPDGGACTATKETCQPRNLGTDCSSYSDCEDSFGDLLCYCHPDATVDAGGLCYLPQPSCGTCTQDADCGNTPSFTPPGYCLPLDGGSFCVPEETNGCSNFLGSVATQVDAGLVLCVPLCNTCPCVGGCNTNADCPAIDAGVCSPSHFCVPPCQADGCGGGEVCNVLDTYLDPGLTLVPALASLYGGGECGPACTNAASCAPYAVDGGVPLACENDPTELNGDRCRPTGCLDSAECTSVPAAPDYISWCNVFDGGVCETDSCRLGLTTGSDCQLGFYCIADGGNSNGECVTAPCNLASLGALVSCVDDQLCCGEGDAGVSTCTSGVSVGSCYTAPTPPWCALCDSSAAPYGQAICDRPANEVQYGIGLGTSFCGPNFSGTFYCQPACDPNLLSACPNGFPCTDYAIKVSACSQCGSNPCADAGYNVDAGTYAYLCGCVDDAGTGCPGSGAPLGCSRQGFCSNGSYCLPGKSTCM